MLLFNLRPIFKARGIRNPYSFLVKSGFTYYAATSILNGSTRSLKLDYVERLCEVLVCEPNDLMVWVPKEGRVYDADFPLGKLKKKDIGEEWLDVLARVPLDKLKMVAKDALRMAEGEGS